MHIGTLLGTLGQTLYHFNGVAPILTGTSNPIILNKKYKQSGMPDEKRQELIRQEASNQIVTMVVHLIMYYGLSIATASILKKKTPQIEAFIKKSMDKETFEGLLQASKQIKKALTPPGEKAAEVLTGNENFVTEKMIEYIKIIVANLGGLLGFGIVRPLLGATLFKHLNKKSGADAASQQAHEQQMRPYLDPSQAGKPLRRIGEPAPAQPSYQRWV